MHLKAIIACVLAAAGGALSLSQAVAATRVEPRAFNIEAQDLGSALKAFAFQSNREIFFAPELTHGMLTHGVVGSYDDLDALKKILADTGLTYTVTDSNAILVRDMSNVTSRPSSEATSGPAVRLARTEMSGQAEPPAAPARSTSSASAPGAAAEHRVAVRSDRHRDQATRACTRYRGLGVRDVGRSSSKRSARRASRII